MPKLEELPQARELIDSLDDLDRLEGLWDLCAEFDAYMDLLSDRERSVISCLWGLRGGAGKTLKEAGEEFGVTKQRIRQIEAKSLRIIKNNKGKISRLPSHGIKYGKLCGICSYCGEKIIFKGGRGKNQARRFCSKKCSDSYNEIIPLVHRLARHYDGLKYCMKRLTKILSKEAE